MTDVTSSLDMEKTISAPPVGLAFFNAREKKKLTIDDVHESLRISPRQIMALETDDFASLPDPMITRGFIRNYARLLGIDAEPILSAYQASHQETAPHSINLQSENIVISGPGKAIRQRYMLASLLVLILLGAWLVYDQNFSMQQPQQLPTKTIASVAPPAPAQDGSAALPEAALPAAERINQGESTPDAPSDQAAVEPSVSQGALPSTQALTEVGPAATAAGRIKLLFTAESWASVTDRNGQEIYNKNKSAGSEDSVEGQPPFNIVIGNVAGTKLIYNDKPVDLAPYDKLNVARFTLE